MWEGTNEAIKAGNGLTSMFTNYNLATRFPDLVNSPGCNERNNSTSIIEMWSVVTKQESAALVLFDLIEQGASENAIQKVVADRNSDQPTYFFLEAEINNYGYRFLQSDKIDQATVMFRINAEAFPES